MDESLVTLDRMRTFTRVAERSSFSAVAQELGLGQSTVSRQVIELEKGLGAELFSRTTRRVTLTEEGRFYYSMVLRILSDVEYANQEVRDAKRSPAGKIRLSCTAALGILHFSRLIFEFQDDYPYIQIDLSLSDIRVDLVEESFDAAIRLGPLSESSLKYRSLGHSRMHLVASPQYLDTWGRPSTPQDLEDHEVICMSNVTGSDVLSLCGPDGVYTRVRVGGRLRVDHGLAAREAIAAGRGIAPAHRWLIEDLLVNGEVEEVLMGYSLPPVPLSILIVPERWGTRRTELLIKYLSEKAIGLPGIEPLPGLGTQPKSTDELGA